MENCELTAMEASVYEAVQEIQGIKRDNGQHPDFAFINEVYNSLRPEFSAGFEDGALGALRQLYRRGLIEFHQTVNGTPMFGIKQQL